MSRDQRPDPIIVLGSPRSGTTYVNAILNSHPDVFVSHEARLFAFLHEVLTVLPHDDRLLVTYGEEFVAHLRRRLPDLVRDFYWDLAPVPVWGDKNPHYADSRNLGCLASIVELFPGARFVHIVRDGRAVVASLLQRKHPDGTPWVSFESAHHTWINHIRNAMAFGSTTAEGHFFEIRYEDLVDDDTAVAERLFEFLDIEFGDNVRDFCDAQHEKRTPFSSPTSNLDDPKESRWETVLDVEQRPSSMRLLQPYLEDLGYRTRS